MLSQKSIFHFCFRSITVVIKACAIHPEPVLLKQATAHYRFETIFGASVDFTMKLRHICALAFICQLFLLSGSGLQNTAFAHPHIFIDNQVEIVFDNKGLAGFRIQWVFDDMSSSGYIIDYDLNHDRMFSANEKRTLKKEVFDYLKNYDYMTYVDIDGNPFKVQFVTDFDPKIRGERLIYNFFIPCHVKASRHPKKIAIAVYDEEFFVNFSSKKGSFRLLHGEDFVTSTKIWININKSFYYNQFHPTEFIFYFKK